jgi:hypothetical protein
MEHNGKFVIKPSGFAIYFFGCLLAFFTFMACGTIKEIIYKGFDLYSILFIAVVAWLDVSFYKFITSVKVEISENQLILRRGEKTFLPIPKYYDNSIDLQDIGLVTIARIKYFWEHADKFDSKELKDVINNYRNLKAVSATGGIPVSVPMRLPGHLVLIYVDPKDKTLDGITIVTRAFSQKSIKELIQELRRRSIPIEIEPPLKLEG